MSEAVKKKPKRKVARPATWEQGHRRVTFYCSLELLERIEDEMDASDQNKTQVIVRAIETALSDEECGMSEGAHAVAEREALEERCKFLENEVCHVRGLLNSALLDATELRSRNRQLRTALKAVLEVARKNEGLLDD